ncbi:Ribose operon repressor [Streptomyces sp. RB5]|uniref:Ribose operon repressor n=1 Tax=Streptomyces smaragdinus TaxID=2585196 RepID=A0A7K0C9Q9_9ACTN|nr:LacI family DNA-binding transcriptional regulator [Streptomyces smaragdinus]MQY10158.1 Ribose operon repressor [Streptomyces smaragdinus]
MKRPTLEVVAARAGVSRASVSRVVNGETTVAPEIREAVLRAVRELGYVPNAAARHLVTRRTDAVALVVSDPPQGVVSDDPLFATVVRTVSRELEAAGKKVVLMLAESDGSRARVIEQLAAGHVDGVVLVALHGADPLPGALVRTGLPVAAFGRPRVPDVPYVELDNTGGAALAVRHLLARGRRRIATITGPLDLWEGRERLAGYRAALRAEGCRPLVALGDFSRVSGAEAMAELLADEPALDAVFAANDLMAVGALRALREAGRRVPEDVAVVGFDDTEAAAYTAPPLTTVRSPMADQALETVRLLLRLLEGGPGDPVVMPNELVVREST